MSTQTQITGTIRLEQMIKGVSFGTNLSKELETYQQETLIVQFLSSKAQSHDICNMLVKFFFYFFLSVVTLHTAGSIITILEMRGKSYSLLGVAVSPPSQY